MIVRPVLRLTATAVAVVAASAGLLSCASGGASHTGPTSSALPIAPSTRPTTSVGLDCATRSAYGSTLGFSLSIATDQVGFASPQLAAVDFTRHGGMPGYGTPTTVWTSAADAQGVTLVSGRTSLHVVALPNHNWAVDGGKRCG